MRKIFFGHMLLLTVSGLALICGLGLLWAGRQTLAHWVWVGGALPALLLLCYDSLRALARREAGIDLLAMLAMGGAITMGED